VSIIHISYGGPDRYMSVGGKVIRFEDHPYCGPIVLQLKTGVPAENQPGERDLFWRHYDAWAKQGKRTKPAGDDKVWCDYETDLQAWRRELQEGTSS
jgi:hypothetical protein